MPQRPFISPTAVPARVSAPHVQAALARAAQAKLPDRPSHARMPAPHVQNAVGAVQRQVAIPPAVTRQPPPAQAKLGGQVLPVRPALVPAQVKLPVSSMQRRSPAHQVPAALRSVEPSITAHSPSPRLSSPTIQAARSPIPNRILQPYMHDHENVEPLAAIIDDLRSAGTRFRARTTRWQKSGVEGVDGEAVSAANTVVSTAVLEWMTLRGFASHRFGPHISGFPFTGELIGRNTREKYYSENTYSVTAGKRKCAERKLVSVYRSEPSVRLQEVGV
jgi:hypothetical protein